MNKFLDTLQNKRSYKDKTLKQMTRYINKIATEYGKVSDGSSPPKARVFPMFDDEGILQATNHTGLLELDSWMTGDNPSTNKPYSSSYKRQIYQAILVMLAPEAKMPPKQLLEAYKHYNSIITKQNESYNTEMTKQKRTAKQIKNWVDWEAVKDTTRNKMNEIRKLKYNKRKVGYLTANESMNLQDYLILGLYSYLPPKRCEYASCKVVKNKKAYMKLTDEQKSSNHYLVNAGGSKKFFSFGSNVLNNSKGKRQLIVPIKEGLHMTKKDASKLNAVINLHLKHNVNKDGSQLEFLLHRSRLEEGAKVIMTNNGLSEQIKKIFYPLNVGPQILRTSHNTWLHRNDPPIIAAEEIAAVMDHSSALASKTYSKKI